MKIKSTTAYEAKIELLRIIYTSDYHHAGYRYSASGYVYVYYNAELAHFYFERQQRKHSTELLKRFFKSPSMEECLHIVASKYTFSQVAVGACLSRKLLSQAEFFSTAKNRFDWI